MYSCESLWWVCFIRNNEQRLVSAFQKWWFRPLQQRPWKTTEKIWRCRIAGIAGRRFNSYPKTIVKSIGSWPGNYFQALTCHWKYPHGENFMAIFTILSVVIWFSTGPLRIFATLVYVFTMHVVIYDLLSMAIITTLSTSILFCNLYCILLWISPRSVVKIAIQI